MTARLAVLGVVLAGSAARAEPPKPSPAPGSAPADPAVEDAADANIETTNPRRGVTFSVAVGGGMMLGFGVESSTGRGGALSLRLGHVATPRTVITFELMGIGALHRPPKDAVDTSIKTNTDTHLLVGGQHWLNDSLWVRAAAGLGVYQARGVNRRMVTADNKVIYDDDSWIGPSVLGGIGIEVVRIRSAAFGFEIATVATVNRDGLLASSCLNLGLTFD